MKVGMRNLNGKLKNRQEEAYFPYRGFIMSGSFSHMTVRIYNTTCDKLTTNLRHNLRQGLRQGKPMAGNKISFHPGKFILMDGLDLLNYGALN
jgi:hypothetical protein